jgi:cysteine desulfurase/selenocysteine lyase
MYNIDKIRSDFPILSQKVHGRPLVYFDNAATTQKPNCVLDKIHHFYTGMNSNIHRGVHYLSEQASDAYERARVTVQNFIGAEKNTEIIFTRSTTEAINLVTNSFGQALVKPGDEIIITMMEHHSNFVPWQILCKQKNAVLKVIPIDSNGTLQIDMLPKLITNRTKLISVIYVSNVLGIVNPIEEIIAIAHDHGIPVLVDGAQVPQHLPTNVQELDCDFFVFSGHKMYATTGIGVLYGKEKWLDALPPYQSGGGMIRSINFEGSTYGDPPFKFEAGTPNIAGALGLESAIQYIQNIGTFNIKKHEQSVLGYIEDNLFQINGLTLYGSGNGKCGVLSFNLGMINAYDAGLILDKMGIAIRTGHHCAEPLIRQLGINSTMRCSLALYNTKEEADLFIQALYRAKDMLG